jgi:hypothetical protein
MNCALLVTILVALHQTTTNVAEAFGTRSSIDRRAFLGTTAAAAALVATTANPPPAASAATTTTTTTPAVGGGGSNKIRYGDESIMSPKAHGTSNTPVQSDLLYNVSNKLADRISNYNRHFAEMAGSYLDTPMEDIVRRNQQVTFYDSNTGKPLFVAPVGRSVDDFLEESRIHGWPSFRDAEVVWDNVRVLRNSGETVSVDGTHLGHNLPDRNGNRYCINLVSIAGKPTV